MSNLIKQKPVVRNKSKRPEKPEPAPKKEASADAMLYSTILMKMQAAQEQMMQQLLKEIGNIKIESEKPPTEWVFDIVRDEETGLIKQIKASVPSRVLN